MPQVVKMLLGVFFYELELKWLTKKTTDSRLYTNDYTQ